MPRLRKPRSRKLNTFFRGPKRKPHTLADPARDPIDLAPETPAVRAAMKADRRRRAWRWTAGILIAALIGFVIWTSVDMMVLRNPRFALRDVTVDTAGMLTRQQLRLATQIPDGANLLLVNMAEVRDRLQRLPAVESAEVTRDYDGHLHLSVVQRQPIAWVQCEARRLMPKTSGRGMLTDAKGLAIPAEVVLTEYEDLPIITDEELKEVRQAKPIESNRFPAALELLRALNVRIADGRCAAVQTITMPRSFALEATFADGAVVTFGHDALPAQLARFDQVCAEAKRRAWTIDHLTVIGRSILPATFRDQAGEPVDITEHSLATASASKASARTTRGQ